MSLITVTRITHTQLARLRSSRLLQRLASGTAWSLIGSLSGKLLTLGSSIYVARVLGQEGFGRFGIIQSTLTSFSLFGGLGLGLTANRFVSQLRTHSPDKAGHIIGFTSRVALVTGAAAALLLFAFSDALAAGPLGAPEIATELRIASAVLLFTAFNGAQTGTLSGLEAFRSRAIVTFFSCLIGATLLVAGVILWQLRGAVASLAISAFILCLITDRSVRVAAVKYSINPRPHRIQWDWSIIWKFSVPAVLSGLSVVPVNWACNMILVNQAAGYHQMGLLNAAAQVRNTVLFLPTLLTSVMLPILTSLSTDQQRSRQARFLGFNIGLSAVIGLGIAAVAAVFSRPIMAAYGHEFSSGTDVLVLQVLAAAVAATATTTGQYLISAGMMWILILLQTLWAVVNLSLAWYLRNHGAYGISVAYLAAYGIHLVLLLIVVRAHLRRALPDSRS